MLLEQVIWQHGSGEQAVTGFLLDEQLSAQQEA
jgi:hypothetical protein